MVARINDPPGNRLHQIGISSYTTVPAATAKDCGGVLCPFNLQRVKLQVSIQPAAMPRADRTWAIADSAPRAIKVIRRQKIFVHGMNATKE
jgi:hypothetical protein